MGVPLFKFAGNIGKKVFNRGEDSAKAAEKLKQHVEKNNPGVQGLQVAVDGETVTIAGSAADQAAFEKAVLIAGNVEGVGQVEAASLQKPDGSESTFILVEQGTNATVAAGMLNPPLEAVKPEYNDFAI